MQRTQRRRPGTTKLDRGGIQKRASPTVVADLFDPAYTHAMASLTIDVVYEDGVFRPIQHLRLPEGSQARPLARRPDAPAITKTAGICGGRACIAGTRITLWGLVSHRNLGLDEPAILAAVPLLTSDQFAAAFRYADENADEIARDVAENEGVA